MQDIGPKLCKKVIEMKWKCYLTIFKAEAPVHIGHKQIGILKTTRYYITGRAIWGAITANLARNLFENPDSKDYQAVGNFVRENIRTTYFYPAIRKNEVENPEKWSKCEVDSYLVFLPKYTQEGIKFGEISKEKFEQMFIGSFISTALESQTKAAEEGSLHEIEYIKNKIDVNAQVYWIGYILINMDANKAMDNSGERVYDVELNEENNDVRIKFKSKGNIYETTLKNCLNIIFVGGERNYGFGRLKLLENGLQKFKGKIFGNFDFELEDKIIFKNLNVVISHIKLLNNNNKSNNSKPNELKLGEIEPLIGLEWSEKGAGQKLSEPIVCATPGSKIEAGDIVLNNYAILKRS